MIIKLIKLTVLAVTCLLCCVMMIMGLAMLCAGHTLWGIAMIGTFGVTAVVILGEIGRDL